tara:strand:+ start:24532 stop:24687 length:156 start_codon:yes stop_codon:yes gene_type:complete
MKAYMVIYMDNFKAVQCVIGAENEENVKIKADKVGIQNIVSIQYLNAYLLN